MESKPSALRSAIVFCLIGLAVCPIGTQAGGSTQNVALRDGTVVKRVLDQRSGGANLLQPDAWRPWGEGFQRNGDIFVCDNGADSQVQRGASQTVMLDQARPEPLVATAWSKAEGVGGSRDSDYSLYLDLTYQDGTPLWGQVAPFRTGSHDWQMAQVTIFPDKPVRAVAFHMLLRGHTGRAMFRDPELRVVRAPAGTCLFDGVGVTLDQSPREGFQVRDVAAGSDFVAIDAAALDLKLECETTQAEGATFFDVTLGDTSGNDRAVTLVYAVRADAIRWFANPRQTIEVESGREYLDAGRFSVGSNGRLSRYPFAAVANTEEAVALGIDMSRPAFFRAGYNSDSKELFLACDVGLTPEKPSAQVRFCKFRFDPTWEFRGALDRYYALFPDAFERRIAEQGLWMPFARISEVKGWQDFGFRFKEGTDETAWDDANGILTFRYTEPMTWWMRMPKEMARTPEAALAYAQQLAEDKADPQARALLTSGYHDETGQFPARLLDTPWCDGAVWSINSMPNIAGEVTDFKNKWNEKLRDSLYGPQRKADLDGEYIDSSEGYVTDELDFRRDHFAASETPLTFSLDSRAPAIFRGLIAFEYIRAIAEDVHAMNRFMMANATPDRLCWLAPLLDVLGTETDWHPSGNWRPMSDDDLLYRRAMCKGKPFCFLMNTRFEEFSHELVEKYMKRCLAYGMFPGFFSHNASQGHYFTRPELYERDRDLFRKYVPLCKHVAEAGWEPITRARADNDSIYVERFGERYLTVFNSSNRPCVARITLDGESPAAGLELVRDRAITWQNQQAEISLGPEDVAVLQLR
ncbi:MAG TPA: hypothetical protein PLU87_18870 [Sedimentisphaerales bacterium]|nr:hypothetical protein [Sedimentisphaerales bacterium]HRS13168.1 hypothetical protein [Sedimentisphaerales bacterium]HRV49728.1 hypothetical protein [Sedimentisphaerales bacterium]